jgi:dihydrofolate reductase
MIGGAQLYTETLTLSDPSFNADRILLTRVKDPSFNECDAFFPEFRSIEDREVSSANGEVKSEPGKWIRSSHKALEDFVGFEVAEGDQIEKGVTYEFQMWTR